MPRRSAGLLVYRHDPAAGLEVLVAHPGGPYWASRDTGWWSIPKGEVAGGEDDYAAARREFEEELGVPAPQGDAMALGEIAQAGGKRVAAWAIAGDVDLEQFSPGTFELEWPPRAGRRQAFPEVDRVEWCPMPIAERKLLPAQRAFLTRLATLLDTRAGQPPDAQPGGPGSFK